MCQIGNTGSLPLVALYVGTLSKRIDAALAGKGDIVEPGRGSSVARPAVVKLNPIPKAGPPAIDTGSAHVNREPSRGYVTGAIGPDGYDGTHAVKR